MSFVPPIHHSSSKGYAEGRPAHPIGPKLVEEERQARLNLLEQAEKAYSKAFFSSDFLWVQSALSAMHSFREAYSRPIKGNTPMRIYAQLQLPLSREINHSEALLVRYASALCQAAQREGNCEILI
jgi:hypothetical protein